MEQRNLAYDLIRALAIIFIVIIHSSEPLSLAEGFFPRLEYAILRSVIDNGIPLFVMLSGALLLGKQESLPVFFKKRFLRLIPPILFWSFVVFLLYRIMDGNKDLLHLFPDYLVGLFTAKIHGIYWFVYMIIGLYLITPILRIVCNEAKPTFYLMIVTGILWILHKAFPAFEVGRQMFAPFIPWIFCFLSGYALTRFLQDNIRVRRIIQWTSLGIFLLNIVLRMTLNLSVWIEIFTAVGLFSLLLEKAPSKLSPVSRALSKYSYGIYLSHFLLISAFIRLVGDRLPVSIHPFIVAAVVLVVIVPLFWVADKLHLRKIVS